MSSRPYVAELDTNSDKYRRLKVNGDGDLLVAIASGNLLAGVVFDYVKGTYPDSTTEVYTFRSGGSGGTISAVITVTFTDLTKELIDEVIKT